MENKMDLETSRVFYLFLGDFEVMWNSEYCVLSFSCLSLLSLRGMEDLMLFEKGAELEEVILEPRVE